MEYLVRFALSIGAATLFAGCGAQSSGTLPQSATPQIKAHPLSGSSGDLLYVDLGDRLSIYSYPDLKRLQIVNTVSGFYGASNSNNGDICFDDQSQVFVYKHGATDPFVTIPQPPSGAESFDCAFDATTNNLAITYNEHNGPYYVSIYSSPYNGQPSTYSDSNMRYVKYAAYDAAGDLFVDGQGKNYCECRIFELPKDSSNFIELQRNYQLTAGPLQWDGQYMTMVVQSVIYRFSVSGRSVTVVGKTAYERAATSDFFTIQGNTAIGRAMHRGNSGRRFLGFWHYPNGRKPIHVIRVFGTHEEKGEEISAAVVSVAPSRSRNHE